MIRPSFDQNWTLFLDRDGVINVRLMADYVKTPEEFELLPGVAAAIKKANSIFGKIVVVTNQQGIGKGIMTERNLSEIHAYCDELLAESKGKIDAYYFAPALSKENSRLRKPNTGMAQLAKQQFPQIEFKKSVLVGDSDSDIEFGKRLDMFTVFIGTEKHAVADETVPSLYDWIKTL